MGSHDSAGQEQDRNQAVEGCEAPETCRMRQRFAIIGWIAAAVFAACSSKDSAGQSCKQASECYAGVADKSKLGTVVCIDKVPNGYCTHTCQQDSDCCAVSGECPNNLKQVCAPFESTSGKYCFLSCETADLPKDVNGDASAYCKRDANENFGCRSTGGGNQNRKICAP
jgi:hypothetical protein